MTGSGTNTYLVGTDVVAVIDPGPDDQLHLERIVEAAANRASCVLVTHHHRDHAPGARPLAERLGVPLLAYGMPGRLEPDRRVGDEETVVLGDLSLRALHTPGHASDHLCFLLEAVDAPGVLFTGDHVMGGSTVVIAPPDGDMGAYLTSLERLLPLAEGGLQIAPGHGELIEDAHHELVRYLERRRTRERAVLRALRAKDGSPADLVARVYIGLDPGLHRMAAASIWAHLRHLADRGLATSASPGDFDAAWSASDSATDA